MANDCFSAGTHRDPRYCHLLRLPLSGLLLSRVYPKEYDLEETGSDRDHGPHPRFRIPPDPFVV